MPWNVPDQASAAVAMCASGAERIADDPLDPSRHLRRRPAREGQEQDAARVGAADDQVRDAVGQRVGLARPGPGNDQERPVAVLGRAPLIGIELVEIGRHGQINRSERLRQEI